jgi:hypothetical protein
MSNSKRTGSGGSDRHTRVGYSIPHQAVAEWTENTEIEAERAFPMDEVRAGAVPSLDAAPVAAARKPSAVEVQLVHENRISAAKCTPWRAVEIWTRNNVYYLDSGMTCIEVVNRATGRSEAQHSLLGARLSGGQHREGNVLEISHPLPVPGAEAMFQHPSKKHVRFGQTSTVERVVLRVRMSTVAVEDGQPFWEEITGRSGRT